MRGAASGNVTLSRGAVYENPQRYLPVGDYHAQTRPEDRTWLHRGGWASYQHDVLVRDADRRRVLWSTFRARRGAVCARLRGALVRLDVRLVAAEPPDGLLAERLRAAGLHLIAIHPDQAAATRPRFLAADGKSDGFDCSVVCELARTGSRRFRAWLPTKLSRAGRRVAPSALSLTAS